MDLEPDDTRDGVAVFRCMEDPDTDCVSVGTGRLVVVLRMSSEDSMCCTVLSPEKARAFAYHILKAAANGEAGDESRA